MFTQKIHKGDVVEISPVNQEVEMETYTSKVEKVEKNSILVYSPFVKLNYARLPITELYWLTCSNGLFRYKTAITNYLVKDRFQYIQFKLLGEGESLQKRSFFRLPINLPVKYSLLRENEYGQIVANKMHDGNISNLSGGGMKMVTTVEMEEKDRIFVSLNLDGVELFLTGEIRLKHHSPDETSKFQYGLMFVDISETDQDKIVRYLFQQQNRRCLA